MPAGQCFIQQGSSLLGRPPYTCSGHNPTSCVCIFTLRYTYESFRQLQLPHFGKVFASRLHSSGTPTLPTSHWLEILDLSLETRFISAATQGAYPSTYQLTIIVQQHPLHVILTSTQKTQLDRHGVSTTYPTSIISDAEPKKKTQTFTSTHRRYLLDTTKSSPPILIVTLVVEFFGRTQLLVPGYQPPPGMLP